MLSSPSSFSSSQNSPPPLSSPTPGARRVYFADKPRYRPYCYPRRDPLEDSTNTVNYTPRSILKASARAQRPLLALSLIEGTLSNSGARVLSLPNLTSPLPLAPISSSKNMALAMQSSSHESFNVFYSSLATLEASFLAPDAQPTLTLTPPPSSSDPTIKSPTFLTTPPKSLPISLRDTEQAYLAISQLKDISISLPDHSADSLAQAVPFFVRAYTRDLSVLLEARSPEFSPSNSTPSKKQGRSEHEIQRIRVETDVAVAAIKALGVIVHHPPLYSAFSVADLSALLSLTLRVSKLPTTSHSSYRLLLCYTAWIFSIHRLTPSILTPLLPDIMNTTNAALNLIPKGNEKAKRTALEGLGALSRLVTTHPLPVLSKLSDWHTLVLSGCRNNAKPVRDRCTGTLGFVLSSLQLSDSWDSTQAEARKRVIDDLSAASVTHLKSRLNSTRATVLETLADQLRRSFKANDYNQTLTLLSLLPVMLHHRFRKIESDGPKTWLSLLQLFFRTSNHNYRVFAHMAWNHLIFAWLAASAHHRNQEDVWALHASTIGLIRLPIDPQLKGWRASEANGKDAFSARINGLLTMARVSIAGIYAISDFILTNRPGTVSAQFDKLWTNWVSIDMSNMLQSSSQEVLNVALRTMLSIVDKSTSNANGGDTSLDWSTRLLEPSFFDGTFLTCEDPEELSNLTASAIERAIQPEDLPTWNPEWIIVNLKEVLNVFFKVFLHDQVFTDEKDDNNVVPTEYASKIWDKLVGLLKDNDDLLHHDGIKDMIMFICKVLTTVPTSSSSSENKLSRTSLCHKFYKSLLDTHGPLALASASSKSDDQSRPTLLELYHACLPYSPSFTNEVLSPLLQSVEIPNPALFEMVSRTLSEAQDINSKGDEVVGVTIAFEKGRVEMSLLKDFIVSNSECLSVENLEDILTQSNLIEQEDVLVKVCERLSNLAMNKDSLTILANLFKHSHKYNSLLPKISSILNNYLQIDNLQYDDRSKAAPEITAFLQNISSEKSKSVLDQLADGITSWLTKYPYDESSESIYTGAITILHSAIEPTKDDLEKYMSLLCPNESFFEHFEAKQVFVRFWKSKFAQNTELARALPAFARDILQPSTLPQSSSENVNGDKDDDENQNQDEDEDEELQRNSVEVEVEEPEHLERKDQQQEIDGQKDETAPSESEDAADRSATENSTIQSESESVGSKTSKPDENDQSDAETDDAREVLEPQEAEKNSDDVLEHEEVNNESSAATETVDETIEDTVGVEARIKEFVSQHNSEPEEDSIINDATLDEDEEKEQMDGKESENESENRLDREQESVAEITTSTIGNFLSPSGNAQGYQNYNTSDEDAIHTNTFSKTASGPVFEKVAFTGSLVVPAKKATHSTPQSSRKANGMNSTNTKGTASTPNVTAIERRPSSSADDSSSTNNRDGKDENKSSQEDDDEQGKTPDVQARPSKSRKIGRKVVVEIKYDPSVPRTWEALERRRVRLTSQSPLAAAAASAAASVGELPRRHSDKMPTDPRRPIVELRKEMRPSSASGPGSPTKSPVQVVSSKQLSSKAKGKQPATMPKQTAKRTATRASSSVGIGFGIVTSSTPNVIATRSSSSPTKSTVMSNSKQSTSSRKQSQSPIKRRRTSTVAALSESDSDENGAMDVDSASETEEEKVVRTGPTARIHSSVTPSKTMARTPSKASSRSIEPKSSDKPSTLTRRPSVTSILKPTDKISSDAHQQKKRRLTRSSTAPQLVRDNERPEESSSTPSSSSEESGKSGDDNIKQFQQLAKQDPAQILSILSKMNRKCLEALSKIGDFSKSILGKRRRK